VEILDKIEQFFIFSWYFFTELTVLHAVICIGRPTCSYEYFILPHPYSTGVFGLFPHVDQIADVSAPRSKTIG